MFTIKWKKWENQFFSELETGNMSCTFHEAQIVKAERVSKGKEKWWNGGEVQLKHRRNWTMKWWKTVTALMNEVFFYVIWVLGCVCCLSVEPTAPELVLIELFQLFQQVTK